MKATKAPDMFDYKLVLFVSFVVKFVFSFWLRPSRAVS